MAVVLKTTEPETVQGVESLSLRQPHARLTPAMVSGSVRAAGRRTPYRGTC